MNIPTVAKPEEIGELVWQSLERFTRTSKGFRDVYDRFPDFAEKGIIKVPLREDLSMLKCKTD